MKYLALIALILLTACGEEDVPQAVVDQNMTISQKNAEKNATSFRNDRFPDAQRVLMDSDSTISKSCRYGDGWASGSLQMPDGTAIKLKCQTNGTGKGFMGCLEAKEFQSKSYASEDGVCGDLTELPKFK